MSNKQQPNSLADKFDKVNAAEAVLGALNKLQFGTIQLTVHQGKLVEIAVTERQRLEN